jgi:hypothetical protein
VFVTDDMTPLIRLKKPRFAQALSVGIGERSK